MHSEIHGMAMRLTSSWQSITNTKPVIRSKLDRVVRQALDELRRAIQTGEIAPGAYREIKARFDRRMVRLERKNQRPLFGVLAIQAKAE